MGQERGNKAYRCWEVSKIFCQYLIVKKPREKKNVAAKKINADISIVKLFNGLNRVPQMCASNSDIMSKLHQSREVRACAHKACLSKSADAGHAHHVNRGGLISTPATRRLVNISPIDCSKLVKSADLLWCSCSGRIPGWCPLGSTRLGAPLNA